MKRAVSSQQSAVGSRQSAVRRKSLLPTSCYLLALLFLSSFIVPRSAFPQEPIQPTRGVFSEAQFVTSALPPVSVVSAFNVGAQGGMNYYYWVVARYARNVTNEDKPAGNATPSLPKLITTAPQTLNGANYVRVCWTPLPDATGYDVLRTLTSGLPSGTASIGVAVNAAANCVSDQGAALQAYTISTYNPAKAAASIKYARLDFPRIVPPVQNAPQGKCRLYVDDTRLNNSGSLGSYWAVTETGDDCWPVGTPGPPGPAVCTDLNKVTDIYVATTGDDFTGDGTAGTPYRTIVRALYDVPGIVCGRYIIHLMDEGEYTGQVNLAGRIFAGGGIPYLDTGCTNLGSEYWPFSSNPDCLNINDNTWPYSWVEIVGSTAHPDGYIIDSISADAQDPGIGVISMSQANLTLRGVSVRKGGFGVVAANKSILNVAGSTFVSNLTGIEAIWDSRIHFDYSGTVNDDNTSYATFSQGIVQQAAAPFNYAIVLAENSTMDDQTHEIDMIGGRISFAAAAPVGGVPAGWMMYLVGDSTVNMAGAIYCDQSLSGASARGCIIAYDSKIDVQKTDYFTGPGKAVGGLAISLIDSQVSGGLNAQDSIALTDWMFGVQMNVGSSFNPPPAGFFTNVAIPYHTLTGGSGFPTMLRGNETFVATGLLPQDVLFSATPTFDPRDGSLFRITLTGDVTSSTITGGTGVVSDGQEIMFLICQDNGGAHAFAWPANVLGADAIGATGNKCSEQRFSHHYATSSWYAVAPMQKNM